ncbi:recombinase family protein [Mesorhizobium sp. WSM3860]|uniref:recombinase family protein n=1 Tax=Mesorhizobium sp. WSM3860 TaxID=2029403 RepID=UPI001FE0B7F4|nr:recombinase family protein [Mesorhizobium sp. WSM3860]
MNRSLGKEAIAYRRVSTDKQGRYGIGLEGQKAAIDRYAQLSKLRITGSFEDVATGRGDRSLSARPGLLLALKAAEETGRPIIVSDLDRLSRHSGTINAIVKKHRITIISAGDGEIRNAVLLETKAARAEREGDLIAERTRHALAMKKAEGVLLGNRVNLPQAQRLGAQRKREIADEKVRQIASVLKTLSGEKTARELVNMLNELGIRTSQNRLWTVPALRRPLKGARALIEEELQRASRAPYADNPRFGLF